MKKEMKRGLLMVLKKAGRSCAVLLRKLGEGLVEAARVWTSSSVKEGA